MSQSRIACGTSCALFALATFACAEPVEYPDWTIDLRDGVPIREHVVVPLEERGGDRIELVEDLVIGSDSNPETTFYRARDLVVDADGKVYVLDAGNHRVQVFVAGGAFVRSFGQEGQGPGEFARPDMIALVGDRLVVNDSGGRLSVWTHDGQHVDDHNHGRRFDPGVFRGSARGTLFANHTADLDAEFPTNVVAEFTLEGEEIAPIADLPMRGLIALRPGEEINEAFARGYRLGGIAATAEARPGFAVGRTGALYVAAGDEYQLLAVDPSGEPRWALRTSMQMPPFPVEDIDRRVKIQAGRNPERRKSDYDWDEYNPAISDIQVDGHGHLWVVPTDRHVQLDETGATVPRETRPVDVYSSDGELLYSGSADAIEWHAAHGDFVYELGADPDTGEQIVVRYRLVEPF